jgi:hypothetical protein
MPYIIPNNLLSPSDKVIKPYNCSMIAVDGPQIKGKLNLEGLEIPYVSQYTSQMILNESSSDQPVLYGFLGQSVTFLMIKASYLPADPNWAVEANNYIEYYFSDNPTKKRYMGELLILTGNSVKRIPQIYLSNPSTSQKVYLEIFMANQAQDSLSSEYFGSLEEQNIVSGLYYNNIISDNITYSNPTTNGSTSLHILDEDDNVVLVIPYENINTITRIDEGDGTFTLLIGTESEEKIRLKFLSEFNMKQAHSRISWVLEDTINRYLTKSLPTIDADPPVITWTLSGSTTGQTIIPWTTGQTISADDIKEIYMSGVTDARDGAISILDTNLLIYSYGSIVPLSAITSEGFYTLYFTVSDIAGNENMQIKYGTTDITPPDIFFYPFASGDTFSMSISGNTANGLSATTWDINTFTVDYVTDNVDSGLTNADIDISYVSITPISGQTGVIDTSGWTYYVMYELTDYAGNTSDYTKVMTTLS